MNKKLLTPFIGYFEKMSNPEAIIIEGRPAKKRAVVTITAEEEQ